MASNVSAASENLEHVKDRLSSAVEHEVIRAAVLASYDQGEIEFTSFGQVDENSSQKPTVDTIFEIGSITKVFTALLVQTFVDEEKLEWDAKLADALPDLEFSSELVAEITLRELATHTSGLPRLPSNMPASDVLDPYVDYDSTLLIEFLEAHNPPTLNKVPAYSNLAFGLLGYICTVHSGSDYGTTLKERVLDPLGMTNSSAQPTDETRNNLAPGYSLGATMPSWNFGSMAGAGSILSSAKDLLSFVEHNLGSEDSEIHNSLRNLRAQQSVPNQGLAWIGGSSLEGNSVYWHNGATGGYASFLSITPDESRAFIILSSTTDSGRITQWGLSFHQPVVEHPEIDFSPFFGAYEFQPGAYLTISESMDQLVGQVTGNGQFPLDHVGERTFGFAPGQISITFAEPVDEHSPSLNWNQAGNEIDAKRVDSSLGIQRFEEVEVDSKTLAEYEGAYLINEALEITIVLREDRLFAQASMQPALPLFAADESTFFYKHVDAKITFERDEAGTVTGFKLLQGVEMTAPKIK